MDWTNAIPTTVDQSVSDEGDATREAFVEFVEKHRERVYRVARRMTCSHEDADDVVQETFLKAFRSMPQFRGDAQVETWLYRIVMNVSLNRQRGRERQRRFLDLFRREPEPSPPMPSAMLAHNELRDRVNEAIATLPPDQRAVVVLFDLEGLPCSEVARA
ncbi:MAG: sigma-70 family RNA polymerase sigma factor, partial [Candidatus Poribacteria bacterium]|nr:sigma-70 family RNA polymerase sigma factor [Candidatus Poribacteria bacterium]